MADAFVLPSLWEGWSLALTEAACAGLPLVATAVGGARELIADGRRVAGPAAVRVDLRASMPTRSRGSCATTTRGSSPTWRSRCARRPGRAAGGAVADEDCGVSWARST